MPLLSLLPLFLRLPPHAVPDIVVDAEVQFLVARPDLKGLKDL